MDLEDFIVALESLFEHMQCFAHLGLLQTDAYYGMCEYYCNTMAEDKSLRAWKMRLENPQTQAVYAYVREKELSDNIRKK